MKCSPTSYYLGSGLLFIIGSAVVYNGWDYNAIRVQHNVVCAANSNVNLLSFLWLIQVHICIITRYTSQGLLLSAASIGLGIFTSYDGYHPNNSFLITYLGLFIKISPKIVKIMHVFNFCQLSTILLDLMILPECNSESLRMIFVIAFGINWFIAIWGIVLRKQIFLPPYLYDPASLQNSYLDNLKVCGNITCKFKLRTLLRVWAFKTN
ncbi:hypothetical protein BEWA_014550 [Theileria equi strain WA]|uniref:Uncharacterized protein n=1 Tax=Theileria equi strain WA TaxID=1537102 RepID=L1LC30_THEEQ|nr:hypothetical protein BEWA_014550 [Theileria equi strain WA]EKX72896.1 hypothetical protein BEWA_014550 [Theileria equi strain WA]|eukprot:XP_004832348.1 hypothetical protein BEWA_014550 [Theileria equi strain WA]